MLLLTLIALIDYDYPVCERGAFLVSKCHTDNLCQVLFKKIIVRGSPVGWLLLMESLEVLDVESVC